MTEELAMAAPHLFLNVGSSSLTDEEIDQMHDQMVANEGRMLDEVMRGQPGPAPTKWSVLPPTSGRQMPWSWMSEEAQEAEIMSFGVRED
jgi:hypothetical protein